jgi:hypothetical protein
MSLATEIGLTLVIAMFATFIAVLGGVNLWLTYHELREKAEEARRREHAVVVEDVFRRAA